jgi:hypothetical protein
MLFHVSDTPTRNLFYPLTFRVIGSVFTQISIISLLPGFESASSTNFANGHTRSTNVSANTIISNNKSEATALPHLGFWPLQAHTRLSR